MHDAIPEGPGIYAIVNTINGHRYVGQARSMRARVRSHVRDLRKGIHATSSERRLQAAWNEFGPDAFVAVVIELVQDNSGQVDYHTRPDNLSLAEYYYINYGACMGDVQLPAPGGWKSVTTWGVCELWLGILPPTESVTLSIPRQALAAGDSIRVGLSWSFVSGRNNPMPSTSDTVVVP